MSSICSMHFEKREGCSMCAVDIPTEESLMKCQECGNKIISDKESVNDNTNEWDEHSYKFDCSCFNKNIRISIG